MEAAYEIHLSPRTWGAGEAWLDIPIDIKLSRDEYGVYTVKLAETGQKLGRVYKNGGEWIALTFNSAYYAPDADLMETTVKHPKHRAADWASLEEVSRESGRRWAINDILCQLAHRDARALQPMIDRARRPFVEAKAAEGERWAIDTLAEMTDLAR